MGIRVVRDLPEDDWRAFVDEHPQGNVFHTPDMARVFARAKGHRPQLWAATDDHGQVLALHTPVQVTLGGNVVRYLTTRAVAYGSVLHDTTPAGQDALAVLLRAYVQERDRSLLFTELRNLSDMTDTQPLLQRSGFAYDAYLNYLVDLDRPAEEVLQGMSRSTRKQIRRGLRKGEVTVEEISRPEQVGLCYALLERTYAQAHVPLPDRSLFDAAFDVLHPLGKVKFLLAWIGDECVAGSVELLHQDSIYGWYGGVDRRHISRTPNELLMWHILRWGAENGYRVYDFGGAGRPDEEYGVRDFKAKFGGELVCHGRNTCEHARWRLPVSKAGYQVYRRVMRGSTAATNGSVRRASSDVVKAAERPG